MFAAITRKKKKIAVCRAVSRNLWLGNTKFSVESIEEKKHHNKNKVILYTLENNLNCQYSRK